MNNYEKLKQVALQAAQEQIADLQRQLADAKAKRTILQIQYDDAKAVNASLRQQLEAARKDGERLDWVEANVEHINCIQHVHQWEVWWEDTPKSEPRLLALDDTFRSVVDAAMSAQPKPEGETK